MIDEKPIAKIDPRNDLNVKQFAGVLCISESFAYWLIGSGKVKAYRLGRRRGWRVPRESIDRYYDELRNGPDGAGDD